MKKKKDILFLCQFFYPEYVSSATLPFDTAAALRKAGFSVDALCGYPKEYADDVKIPSRETVEGIDIRRLRYLQLDRKGVLGRLVNYFSFTFMVLLNLFRLASYRSVVVYSNPPVLPWVAALAKKLFGTKLVFVAYDLYPEMAVNAGSIREGSLIYRVMDKINGIVYRQVDTVVALSQEMKDFILENRGIREEQVAVIPNWYADHGAPACDRTSNRFSDLVGNRFVVSYFGNMGTIQDMQTIFDVLLLLKDDPEVCFLFAGHGNKLPQLKTLVEREKLTNVFVYDFLRGKDFQDALQISDCALVSIREHLIGQCVPSKTYSYMMQGLPLLAIMEECDIVRDIQAGAGIWVKNGESSRLAEEIRSLRNNPEKTKTMRGTCRALYLQKYTTEICTGKYVELFRQLLGR